MSGKFITLEGIDGSGKTTQGIFLKNKLEELGQDVLLQENQVEQKELKK